MSEKRACFSPFLQILLVPLQRAPVVIPHALHLPGAGKCCGSTPTTPLRKSPAQGSFDTYDKKDSREKHAMGMATSIHLAFQIFNIFESSRIDITPPVSIMPHRDRSSRKAPPSPRKAPPQTRRIDAKPRYDHLSLPELQHEAPGSSPDGWCDRPMPRMLGQHHRALCRCQATSPAAARSAIQGRRNGGSQPACTEATHRSHKPAHPSRSATRRAGSDCPEESNAP